MFSSINPWKNLECRFLSNRSSVVNRFEKSNSKQEKLYHNYFATSGFLHSFRSASNRIIVDSSWKYRQNNVNKNLDHHLMEIICEPNTDIKDLSFHPFNDDVLGILSNDNNNNESSLQLLRLPIESIETNEEIIKFYTNEPKCIGKRFTYENEQNDSFRFHPTLQQQFALNSLQHQSIRLYDVTKINEPIEVIKSLDNFHTSSFDYNYVGQTLFTNQIRQSNPTTSSVSESFISKIDLRSSKYDYNETKMLKCMNGTHSNLISLDGQKNRPYVLLSQLDQRRNCNLIIFDIRKFVEPIFIHSECGKYRQNQSTIYLTNYDHDTGLLYLTLRNEKMIITINIDEMCLDSKKFNAFENDRNYFSISNADDDGMILDSTLISKRSMNFNDNQINCLLILTSNGKLLPYSFNVTKKTSSSIFNDNNYSYKHYPPTFSPYSKIDHEMFHSKISLLNRIEWLNLYQTDQSKLYRFNEDFCVDLDQYWMLNKQNILTKYNGEISANEETAGILNGNHNEKEINDEINEADENIKLERKLVDSNHLKYIDGSLYDRKLVSSMPTINQSRTMNFDYFHINEKYAIFVRNDRLNQLSIKIIDPDNYDQQQNLGYINCPNEVNCFAMNPFNADCLSIGLSNGIVQHYTITDDFYETLISTNASSEILILEQLDYELNANDILSCRQASITSIQYHPMAENILATSIDMYIVVWNLEQKIHLKVIECDKLSSIRMIQWNRFHNGCIYIAAMNEKFLSINNLKQPQNNDQMMLNFPKRINPNRLCWAINDHILIVTAKETSNRKILFYYFDLIENKLTYLFMHDMLSLPSFLIPYFDEDTRILYLSGRGENNVHFICLELENDTINNNNNDENKNDDISSILKIKQLESYCFPSNHLAIDFWPRQKCNVKNCEIATGIRMFSNGFEKFRFKVPRNHMEYFHDEIYPPTPNYSKPIFTCDEWLQKLNDNQLSQFTYELIDLKPSDMTAFSSIRETLKNEQESKRKQQLQLNETMRNHYVTDMNGINNLVDNFCRSFAHIDDEPLELNHHNKYNDDGDDDVVDPSEWD